MNLRRGAHLGLAVAAIAAAQLLLLTAPAAAVRPLEVAKPGGVRFVPEQKVGVLLHTAPRLRTLSVHLEGRDVRSSFKQLRHGVWSGGFGPGKLLAGPNHLFVSTVDRAGDEDFATARIVVGERHKGFLSLGVRARTASSVVAKLRLRSQPDLKFRARLNGRGIANRFRPSFLLRRTAHLGADDGLRFGRNVLKVIAVRRDGVYDVERRVIDVRRTRPLVSAGPDRLTAGLRPVALDGRRSKPAASGRGRLRLRHRWSVLSRPRGSRAKPARPNAVRTRFRPDRVGTYRLRLTVTDGRGRRGSDVVTVTEIENVPPIGVPIETMAYNGAHEEGDAEFGIRVGEETHWMKWGPPGLDAIQALILDRSTLEVLAAPTYRGLAADAAKLQKLIDRYGSRALVVISNPGAFANMEVSGAFKDVVEKLGTGYVPKLADPADPRSGWSVIGVPGSGDGADQGAGTNPGVLSGNLRGYLARDSSGLFTFISGSTTSFDTSAPGSAAGHNTIRVGDGTYESEPLACPGAKGAFQVEVLSSETLEPATKWSPSGTFTTNGCGNGPDGTEQAKMASLLNSVSPAIGDGGYKLIFVQSIGSPRNLETGGQWNALASALARVGGTAEVAASATSGYALVGQSGIANFPLTEASRSLSGAEARITGVLQPNDLGSRVPLASSPTAATPFDLAEIAYQPAQAWPHSQTPGEQAALAHVAALLDLPKPTVASSRYVPARPDVRSEYCNERLRGAWAGYAGRIRTARCEARCQEKNGFSGADWENVRAELVGSGRPGEFSEFNAVHSTWKLVRALQAPFGASGVGAEVRLNALATQIEMAMEPPPSSEAEGSWLNMLGGLGNVASYFTGDDLEAFVGTLSGAIGVAAEFADGPEGSPLLGRFQIDAADVAVDLGQNYRTASGQIATVGELVVSDYGKLKALATDPALSGFTSNSAEGMTGKLETGSRQWAYETLFPTAYEALNLEPGQFNNPLPDGAGAFECLGVESGDAGPTEERYMPFSPSPDAQIHDDAPAATLGVLVERGSRLPVSGGERATPRSPAASLLEPLYKPVPQGGLGLHAPWFWRQAFGFPGPGVKNVNC